MTILYSTHEAKTRFSEVMRLVREGHTVTVSYRGKPTAEVRPIDAAPVTLEERLDDLARRGALVRPAGERTPLVPTTRREGALERFLQERNG